MALVVANETYLADLILPFVDVFQMGRVEMMSRAGRGACEIIALRLQEPRPGRAGKSIFYHARSAPRQKIASTWCGMDSSA